MGQTREPNYVCITGVHGVMESQDNPQLKAIHNAAGMVTPDGMPMVWANRLAGNSHVRRVYGPDLMLKVCGEGVAKNYRHYFYGGGEGVAELLKQKLIEKFPGMQVVGTYCPPFRKMTDDEDGAVVEADQRTASADIVWVGLSTPKQENWMSGHIGRLERAGDGRRRRRLRLPRRPQETSPELDSNDRHGMVLPPGDRAEPIVEALPKKQSAVHLVLRAAEAWAKTVRVR